MQVAADIETEIENGRKKVMAVLRTTKRVSGAKRQGKFFYLFLCQVLFLVSFPYLEQPGLSMVLFRLLGAGAFVSGVYAVSDRRAQWIAALALAVPAGVLNTLFALRPDSRIVVPTLVFTSLFLLFTLVSLLRAVVRSE